MNKKILVVGALVSSLVLGSVGMGFAHSGDWKDAKGAGFMYGPHHMMGSMWGNRMNKMDVDTLAKVLSMNVDDVKKYLSELDGNLMRLINAKAIANVSKKPMKEVIDNLKKYNMEYYAEEVLKVDMKDVIAEKVKFMSVLKQDRMEKANFQLRRFEKSMNMKSFMGWMGAVEGDVNTLAKKLSISVQDAKNYLSELYGRPMMLISAKAVADISNKNLKEVVSGFKKYGPYYYITQVLKLDLTKVRQEVAKLVISLK